MSGEDKSEGVGKPGEAGMKAGYIGILAVGLMIGIIIGVAVGAFGFPQAQSSIDANILTADKAGEKVAAFINNNLVQPGTEVTLGEVKEESGLYNVTTSYMENQIPVYITKDGKILFLQRVGWIQIEKFEEMVEQQKEQEENQTQEQESKQEKTIGNFIISGDEICIEEGKPIIYFFGSDGCGPCKWEHPVIHDFRLFRLYQRVKLDQSKIIPAFPCIFYPHTINDIKCRFQLPHNIFLFWISLYKYISLITLNHYPTTKLKYRLKKTL